MDKETKNKIVGTIITGALISGAIGVLVAVFMPTPVTSQIGMIIGFAIGGGGCSMWLVLRKRK